MDRSVLCSIPFSVCSWQPQGSCHRSSYSQLGGMGCSQPVLNPGCKGGLGHHPQHAWAPGWHCTYGPDPYRPTHWGSIHAWCPQSLAVPALMGQQGSPHHSRMIPPPSTLHFSSGCCLQWHGLSLRVCREQMVCQALQHKGYAMHPRAGTGSG